MVRKTNSSLWNNRIFTRLFAAYGISSFGDWFDGIAIMILFGYVWQAGPLLIALLPLTYAVPGILLSQQAGILADRSNKLKLLLLTDIASALLTLTLLFAQSPYQVLILLTLRSTAGVFNLPAQQALTRSVLPEDHLLKAASFNGMVNQGAKILGPLLGASLAGFTSPQVCIAVNVVSFFISALILLSIRKIPGKTSGVIQSKQDFKTAWKEGWGVIVSNRTLLTGMLFALAAMTAIQMVDAQFVVLLRSLAPKRPELTGWLVSCIGLGALSAVVVINRLKEVRAYGALLGAGTLLMGTMFGFLGILKPGAAVYWPLLVAFVGGIGTGISTVIFNYLVQRETPPAVLGRVTGISASLTGWVFVLAPLFGGKLVEALGPSPAFLAIGVILSLIGVFGVMNPRLWSSAQTMEAVEK